MINLIDKRVVTRSLFFALARVRHHAARWGFGVGVHPVRDKSVRSVPGTIMQIGLNGGR